MQERRREARFDIPEDCRGYFEIRLLAPGQQNLFRLLDFSRHGLKLISPIHLAPESALKCSLTAPLLLSGKSISLTLNIRYCSPLDAQFVVGCQILDVSDEMWFRVFEKIHDFVIERAGRIY